jgi:predicted NUDIX family NTP pyrophosphohydrolase
MIEKVSAGLLMYRLCRDGLEFFLVRPGGPFWKKRDVGAWTIPKGKPDPGEELLSAAKREFREEVGFESQGEFLDLGKIQQKGGKIVFAWAFENKSTEPVILKSNTFSMEWPPGSGRMVSFPEIDRGEFFKFEEAKEKIIPSQIPFLERLAIKLEHRD